MDNLQKIYNKPLHRVLFEVFMVVTMKNAVFGDFTSRGSCKNWILRHVALVKTDVS
jgi:hypothetical protein